MDNYHEECDTQNKVILLDFANNSPTDDVKHIIQLYDVDKNSNDIYKLMEKSLKPPLVEAADYLGIDITQSWNSKS